MEPTTRAIRQDELLAQMGWVRELARGLVADPSLADDLAQEAWLAAATRPPARFEDEGGLRAWLATVVRNLARKSGRSRACRERREVAAARPETQPSAADVVARGALHSELAAAVMRLEEPNRSAVLLRYLDGLSALEIARRQGVSHAAARKRISRGLEQLRERLDAAHDGDRKSWFLALTAFVEQGTPATLGSAATTVALPGALALVLKSTLVVATAVLALLAAWMLRPDSTRVSQPDRERTIANVGSPSDAAVAATSTGERSEAVTAQAFEIELTDERGVPREGFLALWLEGGEPAASVYSNASGRVSSPAGASLDQVVLARSDFAPVLVDVVPGVSTQRVVLADGHVVSGHVELPEGTSGLDLVLGCDRPHRSMEALGDNALAALAAEGVGTNGLSLEIERSGPFAFAGLPDGWSGALELQDGWTFAATPSPGAVEDGRALLLLEPAQALELELHPPLFVSGRVVASEDGMPLSDALVLAQSSPLGARVQPPTEARTSDDGRFALGLARPTAQNTRWSLRLLVQPPGRPTLEVARLTLQDLADEGDIGDITVDLGGDLVVVVRDTSGAPLSGAEVVAGGGGVGTTGAPTDSAGRTHLKGVPAQANAVLVSAAGYRPELIELPAGGEVEVLLERSNSLELRVVDGRGAPVPGLLLRVEAERGPFATPGRGGADEELAIRLPFDQLFELDESGTLVLSDLEPGLPLTFSVVDDLGGEAARREVNAPAALVDHEVELVLDQEPFHFSGRAIDATGREIPRVRIYAEGNGQAMHARTDADGDFALGPLLAGGAHLHLEATRPGFLPVVLNGLVPDPRAEPLELVLERGRSLDVFLTDAEGRPVQTPFLMAVFGQGSGGLSDELEPGHHRFDLVPQAPGELQVVLGGVTLTSPVGANEANTRFVLPPTGRLEVGVDTAQLPTGGRTCVVLQAVDREGEVDRTYFVSGEEGLVPRSFSLPAGRYRVQLEQRRLGGPGGARVTLLGEPREVAVAAGRTLSLILP